MAFVTVAQLSALTPGKGICVTANGKQLALFVIDGKGYAVDELCPHRNAPLHEGTCVGLEVRCPFHGTHFDLSTGVHRYPPCKSDIKAYAVQIVGDAVQVDV